MIIYAIPRHDDEVYKNNLEKSIQKFGGTLYEIKGQDNIFTKYQSAINAMKSNNIADDDVVLFVHEDVQILDTLFFQKIQMAFHSNANLGLIGIAGTSELTIEGGWWRNTPDKLRGHLVQGQDQENSGQYLKKGSVGFYDDLVAIDGCIMATTGRIVKNYMNFDVETYKGLNDFYDIDICIDLLKQNLKIATINTLIFHKSTGSGALKYTWSEARDKFINKSVADGITFPLTVNRFVNVNDVVEIEI